MILHAADTIAPAAATVAVTYRREWQDGFGARGWKLDVGIDDEFVIASTAHCGERIPTSVLIHDIVDHHLCGFALSGHRDEAMALVQLQNRTGTDITPDYAQMVDEDILYGLVNGESLETFLPEDLARALPANGGSPERMRALREKLGDRRVRQRLIERFFALGDAGTERARRSWSAHGLDYGRRATTALALQRLLEQADQHLLEQDVEQAHGSFALADSGCRLEMFSAHHYMLWSTSP